MSSFFGEDREKNRYVENRITPEMLDNWKYALDNVFCPETYPTREEAIDAAFEAPERIGSVSNTRWGKNAPSGVVIWCQT